MSPFRPHKLWGARGCPLFRKTPRVLHIKQMRRHERATLSFSYPGEFGRGAFNALAVEFALVVALSHFGIRDRTLLWLLSSAVFFGMMVTVLGTMLTARHRKKTIVFAAEAASRLFLLGAAFVTSGTAFVIVMATGIALNAISVPLVSGIYGANFSRVVRGRAVGRLQAIAVGATALTGAAAAVVMGWDSAYYRFLLGGISVISLVCSFYAWQLPESRRRPAGSGALVVFGDVLRVFTRDGAFVYIEIIWFLFGFANLWLLPMRVLRLEEVGFAPWQIIFATTVTIYATQVFSVSLWGRVVYHMNFAVYRQCINALFIVGILVFFYGESFAVVCFGAVIWGLALAGGALSWRLIATFFTSAGRVPAYMCVHTFFCGIRGILGPRLSLGIQETHGARLVATISAGLIFLTILMLIPLIPAMARRRH